MNALRIITTAFLAVVVGVVGVVGWGMWQTDDDLAAFAKEVRERATVPHVTADELSSLPIPVQRYFAYVLPNGTKELPAYASISAEGDFRRPLTEGFQPTSAKQIISTRSPDFVFHATTPILGPVWATAYDSFVAGRMEMRAKLLSTVTLLHFTNDPKLDRLSLRRWLLEASSWPPALLPGGLVTWQPVDDDTALATVTFDGISENMRVRFDQLGALTEMRAEEDGDLATPYHGPGEHVQRGDYRLIDGFRLPTSMTISRAAAGKRYPFWKARITAVEFGPRA